MFCCTAEFYLVTSLSGYKYIIIIFFIVRLSPSSLCVNCFAPFGSLSLFISIDFMYVVYDPKRLEYFGQIFYCRLYKYRLYFIRSIRTKWDSLYPPMIYFFIVSRHGRIKIFGPLLIVGAVVSLLVLDGLLIPPPPRIPPIPK